LSFLAGFRFRYVLSSFSSTCYHVAMDDKLTPATARDVETCLSLALTSGSSLARNQAAEVTAKIVEERLVAQLERSGFVIMRKQIPVGHPRWNGEAVPTLPPHLIGRFSSRGPPSSREVKS
jgi:hypothetical protein